MTKRKFGYRCLSFLLSLMLLLSTVMIVPLTEVQAASGGNKTGTAGVSYSGNMLTDYDRTVVKLQASLLDTGYGEETLKKEMASLYQRQDRVFYGGLTLLVQTCSENNPRASAYRKEYNRELYELRKNSWTYCDWSGMYIEDYKSQICANSDGAYFYNLIKNAVKGMNPGGVSGAPADSTPIGEKLNTAIKGADKTRFVNGYKYALTCVYDKDCNNAKWQQWLATGASAMIATLLQGCSNTACKNESNGTRSYLVSTHMFVQGAQYAGAASTTPSYTYEGKFLNNPSGVHYIPNVLNNWLFQVQIFRHLSQAMYPKTDSGKKLTEFGGWGYYSLADVSLIILGHTTIERANVFRVGNSCTEGAKFGQVGIVAVQNIAPEMDDANAGHVKTYDFERDRMALNWNTKDASLKCNTPYKDAEFSLVGYRYKVISNDTVNPDGTFKVFTDWTEVSGKSLEVPMSAFGGIGKEPSYRLIEQAIYQYNLADNYKASSAAQNLLTVTFPSLKGFTKSGTVPNNLVDDRFSETTVIARNASGQPAGFGTIDWLLGVVDPSFVTSFSAYGNGLSAGKTYQTQSSSAHLAGAKYNNWGTTQHDASVWVSRAAVNDVVRLASWSNNGAGVTDFLVKTGKFLNSTKGRGTQPTMSANGVAGFVRSNASAQSIGTQSRTFDAWNSQGTAIIQTWSGTGTVEQGAIDTQVGANFARYTPKTLYPDIPKGVSKGIKEYSSDNSYSAAVTTGKSLYVNPEVTMQYQIP
jgi:hypothetical protein